MNDGSRATILLVSRIRGDSAAPLTTSPSGLTLQCPATGRATLFGRVRRECLARWLPTQEALGRPLLNTNQTPSTEMAQPPPPAADRTTTPETATPIPGQQPHPA